MKCWRRLRLWLQRCHRTTAGPSAVGLYVTFAAPTPRIPDSLATTVAFTVSFSPDAMLSKLKETGDGESNPSASDSSVSVTSYAVLVV